MPSGQGHVLCHTGLERWTEARGWGPGGQVRCSHASENEAVRTPPAPHFPPEMGSLRGPPRSGNTGRVWVHLLLGWEASFTWGSLSHTAAHQPTPLCLLLPPQGLPCLAVPTDPQAAQGVPRPWPGSPERTPPAMSHCPPSGQPPTGLLPVATPLPHQAARPPHLCPPVLRPPLDVSRGAQLFQAGNTGEMGGKRWGGRRATCLLPGPQLAQDTGE